MCLLAVGRARKMAMAQWQVMEGRESVAMKTDSDWPQKFRTIFTSKFRLGQATARDFGPSRHSITIASYALLNTPAEPCTHFGHIDLRMRIRIGRTVENLRNILIFFSSNFPFWRSMGFLLKRGRSRDELWTHLLEISLNPTLLIHVLNQYQVHARTFREPAVSFTPSSSPIIPSHNVWQTQGPWPRTRINFFFVLTLLFRQRQTERTVN